MTFDWTILVEIAIFCLIAVIAVVLIPWLKEKLGAERVNQLWRWVCLAVQAAEQLFGPGTGEQKKQYVSDFLAENGVEVTPDVDVMIEAAVRELTE